MAHSDVIFAIILPAVNGMPSPIAGCGPPGKFLLDTVRDGCSRAFAHCTSRKAATRSTLRADDSQFDVTKPYATCHV